MGAQMTQNLRAGTLVLAVLAACMGEKPNGLRADGSAPTGIAPVITGLKGDKLGGRLAAAYPSSYWFPRNAKYRAGESILTCAWAR